MVQSTSDAFRLPAHQRSAIARTHLGSLLILTVLLLACDAHAQRGALTSPRNIGELASQAATILRGRVLTAFVEPHPQFQNLSTITVSVRVQEVLKGNPGSVFTFRQFIWDIRDRYDTAGYRKGQELLLLMNAPSPYGLTSPAGMDQGRFRIVRSPGGIEAVNGSGNAGLFRGLFQVATRTGVQLSPRITSMARAHRGGPVALGQLEEVIRQFARSGK